MIDDLPTGLTVRHPVAEDQPRILAVLDAWWGGFQGEAGSRERALLLPRLYFQHFTTTSYLVEREGEPVAFLVGFHSQSRSDVAYIHFVGVDPAWHGRGIAKALYRGFFDQAWESGRRYVHSVTSPGNAGSRRFHARLGFETLPDAGGSPVRPDYDGPGLDRVAFTLDLTRHRETGGTGHDTTTTDANTRPRPALRLAVLDHVFALDHLADDREPRDDAWHALVRAPEGLTVVRNASADTPAAQRWIGLYDADAQHGLDVPGLLASLVQPLAEAAVPVFVCSTYHADLLLVPDPHRAQALAALRAAGHEVVDTP
ncbi:GNAT family N-acetyltransferase [Embleya sp. NPDC050493]|uniref:GNAT family N-acetyltransferase n=1 Tax=Embleya sp. NPDC050493 TaxID=3363989 RepID=UPI0037988114